MITSVIIPNHVRVVVSLFGETNHTVKLFDIPVS